MPQPGLSPGDTVVDLSALVQSAALVSGGVAGVWVGWFLKRSWLASAGAFVAGAVLGFVVAQVVARVLYRAPEGQVTVVKAGSVSLSSTIPAALAGGVSTAVVVALAGMLLLGTKGQVPIVLGVAVGCGVAVGILLGCLSSLA